MSVVLSNRSTRPGTLWNLEAELQMLTPHQVSALVDLQVELVSVTEVWRLRLASRFDAAWLDQAGHDVELLVHALALTGRLTSAEETRLGEAASGMRAVQAT